MCMLFSLIGSDPETATNETLTVHKCVHVHMYVCSCMQDHFYMTLLMCLDFAFSFFQ